MTRTDPRSNAPPRARLRWLAAALALAFAVGLARELTREPEPPPAAPPAPAAAPPVPARDRPVSPPAPPPAREAAAPPAPSSRREEIRALLEASLAEHFPTHKLSSDELDAASDALLRLRAARLELRSLPRTPENAARIEALVQEIGAASADFEYVVDVDPITFTERASGEVDEDDEEAP